MSAAFIIVAILLLWLAEAGAIWFYTKTHKERTDS